MAAIRCQNVSYESVKLSVMNDLCSDIFLGYDFLGLHEKMEISVGGERRTLYCAAWMLPKCSPLLRLPTHRLTAGSLPPSLTGVS